MTTQDQDPTRSQFAAYTAAYDYFNEALFAGELPRCILNFSRRARTGGFFAPDRWERADGRTHEISINPDCLKAPPRWTMSVLVHEMVHLWQQECGQPSATTYHNQEYAWKMEEIGLITSDTGQPGGRRVGQRISHYVIDDGPFALAYDRMPPEYLLPWTSSRLGTNGKTDPKEKNKVKYTCPGCAVNVWGKPGLAVVCGECGEPFVASYDAISIASVPE